MKTQKLKVPNSRAAALPIRIYIDGAGQRPDGKGSCFAWVRESTGEKQISREDGLTNNQAEYKALLAALKSLATGTTAEILTDSMVLSEQFHGRYRILNSALSRLLDEGRELIARKKLAVTVSWIPRQENLAGKLL